MELIWIPCCWVAVIAWVSGLALLVHVFFTWLLAYKLKVGFFGIAIVFGFSWYGCFVSSIKGIWTGMLSGILDQTLLLEIMIVRCDWEKQCVAMPSFYSFFKKTFNAKSFISLFLLFILFFFILK